MSVQAALVYTVNVITVSMTIHAPVMQDGMELTVTKASDAFKIL